MCYNAQSSWCGWLIATVIGIVIWFRNETFDRPLAVFIISFGIIQLLEAGYHSNSSFGLEGGGKLIPIALWFQCLAFNLSLAFYFTSVKGTSAQCPEWIYYLSIGLSLLYILIFGIILFDIYTTTDLYLVKPACTGHLAWLHGIIVECQGKFTWINKAILGSFSWLYLLGITAPLILLQITYPSDPRPFILFLYGLGTFIYSIYGIKQPGQIDLSFCMPESSYNSETATRSFNLSIEGKRATFGSLWCYLAVGFAMLVYILGIVPGVSRIKQCSL